jgi:hypothetical protein
MDRPRNQPMRPLVLVVDEHEDTRDMYALALSAMGFDMLQPKTGAMRIAARGRSIRTRSWPICRCRTMRSGSFFRI